MPCFSPLSAVRRKGFGPFPDGQKVKIISSSEKEKWNPEIWEHFQVPCGKCIGCRIDSSRQWADRCMLEASYHASNYFVTLTYDDLHVPTHWYTSDINTGEAMPSLSLERRDCQLFLKRLRKRTGQKIRFFGCGEYGSNTFRPHYHLILFGLELNDLVPSGRSRLGFQYYESDTINKAWSIYHTPDPDHPSGWFEPLGYASVGACTWETCAYTARYVTKKLNGALGTFYRDHNIEPEFSQMSRRPGIGRDYYDEHRDELYQKKYINLSTEDGGRKIKPPKYYDYLYDIDCPSEMYEIKQLRQHFAEERQKIIASQSDYDEFEYMKIQEENFTAAIKALRRDMI